MSKKYLVSFSLGHDAKMIFEGDSPEEVSCFAEQVDYQYPTEWSVEELEDNISYRNETGEVFVVEFDTNKIPLDKACEVFKEVEGKVGTASVIAIPDKQCMINGMSKSECIKMLENLLDYMKG